MVEFTLWHAMKAQRSSTGKAVLFLTSALDGVGGWCHAPAALFPRMARYPLYKGPGMPHGRSGRLREILPAPGFDPQTIRSVASRYTDYTISAHTVITLGRKLLQKNILTFPLLFDVRVHRANKSWHQKHCFIIFDALRGKILLIFGENFRLSSRG
jgi:hypothetical protein